MAEITLNIINELRKGNAELRRELVYVVGERDEALNKAVEISHMLTYAAEQGNRKGLVSMKGANCGT